MLEQDKETSVHDKCIAELENTGNELRKELNDSRERYRAILENIEDGYYEVNMEGRFTFFNKIVSGSLGYTEEELKGMNYKQYMDEINAVKVFGTFHDVFLSGVSARCLDWELIRKDGTTMHVETSVSLMKDSLGAAIGFRGIIRDVSERKAAEDALRRAHDQLEIRVQERTSELEAAKQELENTNRQLEEAIAWANKIAMEASLDGQSKERLLAKIKKEAETPK